MRIRKNLKLSAQSSETSPLICKLNQSSWDVMSSPPSTPRPPSPPPPPQVEVSAGNEGLDLLAAATEELENREREQDKNKNKNNNDSTDSATKKPPVLESRSCPPSKNASTSSDSDIYLYYMGFGVPGRGKRRGEHSDNSGSSASKNPGQEHDQLNPLYLDSMIEQDFDYNEDEEEETREKGKKRAKEVIKGRLK